MQVARSTGEIQGIVVATIAETFKVPVSDISPRTVAAEIDGWDSVSNSLLYLALEEKFATELPIERLIGIENVGELCQAIETHLHDI